MMKANRIKLKKLSVFNQSNEIVDNLLLPIKMDEEANTNNIYTLPAKKNANSSIQ